MIEEDIITIETWFKMGYPKEYVHKEDGLYYKSTNTEDTCQEKVIQEDNQK